uniref:BPTI/Kunitz inhibitor domain-containing protein n=1 Tax=Hippocampus comes TaxID=109280 RepID=A0A3Q3E0Y3_HIPCM
MVTYLPFLGMDVVWMGSLPLTDLGEPDTICSLPRDKGPCNTWKRRFYFNASIGECKEFGFGRCQGNANNFASLGECQRACEATPEKCKC